MKNYLALSCVAHGFVLGFVVLMGTWLAKPRMAYYSVDLLSMPSGTPGGGPAAAVSTPAKPIPAQGEPEEIQRVAPQPKVSLKESIRLLGKVKKKIVPPKPVPVEKPKPSAHFEAAMRALGRSENSSAATGTGEPVGLPGSHGGGGAGVIGEAGNNFPYPWYLKSIADRLDKQWHPPREFEADTLCQVVFTVHRDGQLSESKIEKSSGDTFFDQLALRAVLYSNPLPPLPGGFPDETLRVHMKFVGKRI